MAAFSFPFYKHSHGKGQIEGMAQSSVDSSATEDTTTSWRSSEREGESDRGGGVLQNETVWAFMGEKRRGRLGESM